ncbi:MAG: hypothetical protein WCX46_03015 [Candidatus Paceibacterota bacterium]
MKTFFKKIKETFEAISDSLNGWYCSCRSYNDPSYKNCWRCELPKPKLQEEI